MGDSTTKQTASQIYADVGTQFDLGGGRTGPDMAVEALRNPKLKRGELWF